MDSMALYPTSILPLPKLSPPQALLLPNLQKFPKGNPTFLPAPTVSP